jgi:hypothetical protein
MKNTLFWSTAFLSLLQGVWAGGGPAIPGTPGATNAVPGMATNTPPTMVPGAIPGGVGTIPAVPGMVPGGVPGMAPTNGIPGGAIPGAPAINPGTGIPIPGVGVPGAPGPTPVSTNSPPPQIQEIVTPEMIQEAMRVYLQGARVIREEAENGLTRQQHNLAVLYGLGLGVPLDHQKAFEWYKKAADEGLPESQFNLAIAYQNGMGTNKDLVNAFKYYILASAQGLMIQTAPNELPRPLASEYRDYLARFLNREQIETSQRMARGFTSNLERRRYYKRRQLFDKYKANLILSGKNHMDPNNYSEYLEILLKTGTPIYDLYNRTNFFPPMIDNFTYQRIPSPAILAPSPMTPDDDFSSPNPNSAPTPTTPGS